MTEQVHLGIVLASVASIEVVSHPAAMDSSDEEAAAGLLNSLPAAPRQDEGAHLQWDSDSDALEGLLQQHRTDRPEDAQDLSDTDVVAGLIAPRPVQQEAQDSLNLLCQQCSAGAEFGKAEHLCRMGSSDIQRELGLRFVEALRTPAKPLQKSDAAVRDKMLLSNVTATLTALAEATNTKRQQLKRSLLSWACLLLHACSWLLGTLLNAVASMLDDPACQYKPVCTISKWKYDETPLRMKVSEWQAFTENADGQLPERNLPEALKATGYTHAKIFRVEWHLSPWVFDSQ